MRALVLFAVTLPLWAQAPAQAPTPTPTPAPAPAAAEDWLTGNVEVGYRWMPDVGGDFNTYRSVVNLGEGPKLLGADFLIQPKNTRLADRIDVNLASWGGDPYNTARIGARRSGLYDFRFDYRNIAYFNFLPSFSNPGRVNPALPFLDQYGFDIRRRVADAELELFPGRRIIPYLAYGSNGGRGDGTINFVVDSNAYTVPTRYSDHTNQGRGGVRFEFNRWHLTLETGGSSFSDDQAVFQGSQLPNFGNRRTPFLGQTLFFSGGGQNYGIRGQSVFTRGLFTASPVSWVDISAQFLYSQPRSDAHYTQQNTGQFVNIATILFYNQETVEVSSTAKQPHPSGSLGIVLRPFGGRLRVLESWSTDRMHSAGGAALLDQLLVTGQEPTAQNAVEAERVVVNYNQQEINLLFDVTGRLTLRAGHRYQWGDTTAPPSLLLEEVTPEGERAKLARHVALAGVSLRMPAQFRLTVDFEASPGGPTFFRTSLNHYRQARILGRWQPVQSLKLTARFNLLSNENPDPAVRNDFLSRDNALSFSWNPSGWKGFGVVGEYSRSSVRSRITYIIPNLLAPDLSDYHERAHIGTLLADVPFSGWKNRFKLSLGGSFFRSAGSRPTQFYQPMARFGIPLGTHLQFNTEWRWYGLSERYYVYEGFRSHQFTTALRFTM